MNSPQRRGDTERKMFNEAYNVGEILRAIQQFCEAAGRLSELRVIRTKKFVGDIGEWIVARALRVDLPPNPSEKGWDVKMSTGERVQVKTFTTNPSQKPSMPTLRRLSEEGRGYDSLAIVILDASYLIRNLWIAPLPEWKLALGGNNKWKEVKASLKPLRVHMPSILRPVFTRPNDFLWDDELTAM